jgi:hypothetical protein
MKSSFVPFAAIAIRLVGDLSVLEWNEYFPLFTAFLQVLNTHLQDENEPSSQILDAALKVQRTTNFVLFCCMQNRLNFMLIVLNWM